MMRTAHAGTLAVLLVTLAGCSTIPTPEQFVRIPTSDGIKFATADDARLWIREQAAGGDASLEFWVEALKNDLIERRGYLLVEETPVTTEPMGHELIFDATVDGLDYRYLVMIQPVAGFWEPKIRTVEYLAPRSEFDRYVTEVRRTR